MLLIGILNLIRKHVKCSDKNKDSSYLNILNNFYGWEMSQKLRLGGFKLV